MRYIPNAFWSSVILTGNQTALAVYDVVVGVNYGAVVNSAALATVYAKAVAIE